uniref:Uncharacterized protein n=1 Tax=Daphnia galeata TaxID=27404 RepID=A0A8J2WJP7_9CRUS|nr:unnamed protein product [Daphnia galeata]
MVRSSNQMPDPVSKGALNLVKEMATGMETTEKTSQPQPGTSSHPMDQTDSSQQRIPETSHSRQTDFETSTAQIIVDQIPVDDNFQEAILELDECFNVTDSGVQLLCFNYDGIDTDNQRPAALCKTLQHLSIYSTSVTNQGIQMAINNLIVLKSLVHERLYEFLLDLIKTRFDIKNLPKIQSIPLTCFPMETISPYESGSLAQEDLDISFFIVVDIWTIFKFCPYLYIFTFYRHCDSVTALSESELELNRSDRSEKERFILKNLVELDCYDCNSPDILHFLWSFPLLANIYSVVFDTVTDEFLFDAVKFHKFKNLRKISLRYCDFVTKRALVNAYEWHRQAKRESWKFEIFFQNSDTVKYYSTDKYLLL